MEIENFYEEETGRSAKQGKQRVAIIKKFLEDNKLTLDQIKLEMHKDYQWNTRRNRTEKEAKARVIGSTNSPYNGNICYERWWVMPK